MVFSLSDTGVCCMEEKTDFISRNCEFRSRISEKTGQKCEMKICSYLLKCFIVAETSFLSVQ